MLHRLKCRYSSSVEYQLPKLRRRVRFPLSARKNTVLPDGIFLFPLICPRFSVSAYL